MASANKFPAITNVFGLGREIFLWLFKCVSGIN